MTPHEETPMVAMAVPAVNPAELLGSVDAWLNVRAFRTARNLGLEWEDVLQEFRVRVFLHAHSYDPARGKPTTWATSVCRSAVNRIVEARKRTVKTWGESPGAVDMSLGEHPDNRLPPPDANLEAEDNTAAVLALLDQVDPMQARAVALRFGIGEPCELTGEELGARLGVNRQRACELVRAGLEALRVVVAGQDCTV